MRRAWTVAPVLLALASTAAADDATTTTYALTAQGSDVYVVIRNDREATAASLGHDHVIYARDFQGTVVWPVKPGGPCTVDIEVPVTALIVDPPGLRAKAGLDPNATIDDSDKGKLSKNMWGGSQLDASRYPAVRFHASTCPGGTGKVKVDGTMTIRGTSRPVSIVMDVKADASTFSAAGQLETTHSAFGLKPFAATLFGPRNQDRLTFAVSVKGHAR